MPTRPKKPNKWKQRTAQMNSLMTKAVMLERARFEDVCNKYIYEFLSNPDSETHERAKESLTKYLEQFDKHIKPFMPESKLMIKK